MAKRKTSSTKSKRKTPSQYKRLADHLQLARRNRRISIRKIAQITHLPESTIRALEHPNKSTLPSSNVAGLYKIYAQALDVPSAKVDVLLGGSDTKKPEFNLRRLPKLKSLVVFKNITTTSILLVIVSVVFGYAIWQGVGLFSSPELSVTFPTEQYVVVDESSFEVRGSAARESSVLINGEPTTVDSQTGEFTQIVYLQEGYNYISVEVVNSFATVTTENFVVVYRPTTLQA